MITSLVLLIGALHIGWNKDDDQTIPVGYDYEMVGDDGKRTLEFESWYDIGKGEGEGGSAPSFAVDENGKVTLNALDPAIGWGK